MPKKRKRDFDIAQALFKSRVKAKDGHMGTIDPVTGAFLKSRGHSTFAKGVEGERKAGNIVGTIRGKLLSIPTKRKGFLKSKNKFTKALAK